MTMRLFVYEYASAVGPSLPASIRAEGWAMLAAVVEDCAHIPNVDVTTLLHDTCHESLGHFCLQVDSDREQAAFRAQSQQADFTLVIAPETAGVLARRSRWALDGGGQLLGSSLEAIEQTGDKLGMSDLLGAAGVQTPKTVLYSCQSASPIEFPAVLKPRDGAGSQATYRIGSYAELDRKLQETCAELPGADFILQPHIAGIPVSVAFIIFADGRTVPMTPCRQLLSNDGRFRYLGGELPLTGNLGKRAVDLADSAVRAVPGLRGYIGVDLVLGDNHDGSGDHVIEINPRLTTSYIGLRQLADFNIAEAMLAAVNGGHLPDINWKQKRVRFRPGRLRLGGYRR